LAVQGEDQQSQGWQDRRILPLFQADDDRVLTPTAHYLWDRLVTSEYRTEATLDPQTSQTVTMRQMRLAEEHGRPVYDDLVQAQRARITQLQEKARYAFNARRQTIERVGLPEVRNYRLNNLEQEERAHAERLKRMERTIPDLSPVLIVRVEGDT
jgi:hypothetical protein